MSQLLLNTTRLHHYAKLHIFFLSFFFIRKVLYWALSSFIIYHVSHSVEGEVHRFLPWWFWYQTEVQQAHSECWWGDAYPSEPHCTLHIHFLSFQTTAQLCCTWKSLQTCTETYNTIKGVHLRNYCTQKDYIALY